MGLSSSSLTWPRANPRVWGEKKKCKLRRILMFKMTSNIWGLANGFLWGFFSSCLSPSFKEKTYFCKEYTYTSSFRFLYHIVLARISLSLCFIIYFPKSLSLFAQVVLFFLSSPLPALAPGSQRLQGISCMAIYYFFCRTLGYSMFR